MKNTLPWMAVIIVLIALFNVCYFTITASASEIPPSVWLSYAFIHTAFLLLLCTPLMVRHGNNAVADYRRPLYVGTWIYFVLTLIVNVAFIIVSLNSVLVEQFIKMQASPKEGILEWIIAHLSGKDGVVAAWILKTIGTPISVTTAVITNVVMFGSLLVYLIFNIAANADTATQQERQEQELTYVKEASSRLRYIASTAKNRDYARRVGQLCDLVSSSPLRSCTEAKALEQQINNMLGDLERACRETDEPTILQLCTEIADLIRQRNRIASEKA